MITEQFIREIENNVIEAWERGDTPQSVVAEICRLIDAKLELALQNIGQQFLDEIK